ncbi:MAG TPA: nicotinate-nucleotide--dimethylbenzimidazole phosphoribosyltransferase [Gemmatimonadaceae bacterium]|nr:nicotinate-nucleotide--dimethylbenzimidazole phosphoribosyltransferase [Gemmatimonadaceae bacterium]
MTGEVTLEMAGRAMAAKTKPLGALGRLEDVGIRLSVLQGTLAPRVHRARVCVFGADHGVTDEGVSAYPRAVTGEMMKNFARGGAAINVIARANDVDVEVIDVGVEADLGEYTAIRQEKIRPGSRNMIREPALSAAEVDAALRAGANAARRARHDGVDALGLGEMGIGNTTSAAAILCAIGGAAPEAAVGRGTGIDDEGLARKCAVVSRAVALHRAMLHQTGMDALRCVGGYEIAAIAGAALEASRLGLAVVADGFISSAAVLAALRIATDESEARAAEVGRAVFFAHLSAESGHRLLLSRCAEYPEVDARPLIDLGLRLGEGTAAALAVPFLRAAADVMRDMATFASAGVSTGERNVDHTT